MKLASLVLLVLLATASATQAGVLAGRYAEGPAHDAAPYLTDMVNKPVLGPDGSYLGRVYAVDAKQKRAQILLPSGVRIVIDAGLLIDGPVNARAPSLSQAKMVALARLQTGRAVAFE
jgi:hypothetical protein